MTTITPGTIQYDVIMAALHISAMPRETAYLLACSNLLFPQVSILGKTLSSPIPETVSRSAGVLDAVNKYDRAYSPIDRKWRFAHSGR